MSDIVEYLRSDYCSCLDAYKDRGRIDPQCESCNTKDERTAAADLIDTLKEQNALLTVQVQEGWKLVPVEPTADMIIAAGDGYETGEVIGPASCYRVMIAAAPALPQQVKSEDARPLRASAQEEKGI